MVSFFTELFEILASIPFFGIIGTIFRGEYGWRVPVAFVLQVVLQIVVALMLPLSTGGTIALALFLVVGNLLMGLVIGMMPLSGMGPNPISNSAAQFLQVATVYSLVGSVIGNGIVLGIACLAASAGWGAFFGSLALSTLGATAIHLFGVALPIFRAEKAAEQEAEKARKGS